MEITYNDTHNFCQYPQQVNPQRAYIELHFEDETLCSGVNYEIGNAIPCYVWEGKAERWGISPYLTVGAINELLDMVAPLAKKAIEAYDDQNSETLQDLNREIERIIEREYFDTFNVFSWEEWLESEDLAAVLSKYDSLHDAETEERNFSDNDIIEGDLLDYIVDVISEASETDNASLRTWPSWVWEIPECKEAEKNNDDIDVFYSKGE